MWRCLPWKLQVASISRAAWHAHPSCSSWLCRHTHTHTHTHYECYECFSAFFKLIRFAWCVDHTLSPVYSISPHRLQVNTWRQYTVIMADCYCSIYSFYQAPREKENGWLRDTASGDEAMSWSNGKENEMRRQIAQIDEDTPPPPQALHTRTYIKIWMDERPEFTAALPWKQPSNLWLHQSYLSI